MRVTVVTAAGDEVVGASLVLVAVATVAGLAAGLSALRTRRGGGDGGGGSNGDDVCAGGGASGESLSLVDDGGEGELVDGDPLDHHTFIAWGTPAATLLFLSLAVHAVLSDLKVKVMHGASIAKCWHHHSSWTVGCVG